MFMPTIEILERKKCTGCGACSNICPTNAIEFNENDEGFKFPHILDEICIQCGRCEKICPVLHPKYLNDESPKCYAVIGKDELREKSSSGGFFSILAKYVLKKRGIVCGAAFTDDKKGVEHILISKESELDSLRTSKYIQSDINFCYRELKDKLDSGRLVLFSGCPCQVAGLKNFLSKDYENLITADIVCHGVPSSFVFEKFLNDISTQNELEVVNFRNKKEYGWTPTMQIVYKDKSEYYEPKWKCDYYKAFLSIMACRESCGDCQFNRLPRQGDFTLGDFWGIGEVYPELDDNKGTSLVLINNQKAEKLFNKLTNQLKKYKNVDINIARKHNWNVFGSSRTHWERKRFFKLLKTHTLKSTINRITDRWFDVGIVGWWYGKNYGSALTYFALHEVIEGMGYDVLMLEWPWKTKPFPPISNNNVRRFAKKHYQCSAQYTFDEYPSLNNHIDQFLVGSDQLWNYYDSKDMGNYYMLDFVKPEHKKISYATSFGHPKYSAPKDICEKQSEILKTFDAISVREDDGVKICKEVFGVNATQVLDPVFLCPIKKYLEIINETKIEFSKPYLLAYILSPNKEKGELLKNVADELGLDLIIILDGQTNFDKNKELLGIENVRENVGIEEWLSYIYNASFVVTDSFHGVCFSLIFEKQFICLLNFARGISRFETLLGKLELKANSVSVLSEIFDKNVINKKIDYEQVNQILYSEKKRSYEWLKHALQKPKHIENNPNVKGESFSCFAGCVTRDVFNFLNKEDYNPLVCLGFSNISAMEFDAFPISIDKLTKGSNYSRRNIVIDLNKTLLQKIDVAQTDWFIFDVISERLPIMQFSAKIDGITRNGYATKTLEFVDNWHELLKSESFSELKKIKDITIDDLFDSYDYKKNLEKFCKNILEKYPSEKIIFNEAFLSEYYIDENNILRKFNYDGDYKIVLDYNNPKVSNPFLQKVTEYIESLMPGINIIRMPNNNYSDSNHWFGLHPLHFNKNYYKYLADCVKVITSGMTKNEKEKVLNNLWQIQSRNNQSILDLLWEQRKYVDLSKTEKKLHIKWRQYSDAFKSLIVDLNIIDKDSLVRKLKKNGIASVSIYGNTEITKVLIELLKETPIRIDYIVENEPINGIMTIPRDAIEYPVTNLMLIADVENSQAIIEKLRKRKVSYEFVKIEEFIKLICK